ncbi:MAG TPA: hypothetical protein VGH71_07350 [Gammaproteobacteria bacterium]
MRTPALLLSSLLLSACGSLAPLAHDGPVHLAPNQGLAALVIDTLDPLTDVEVEPRGGGRKLMVASVPVGRDVYLFPVPAGTYCMTRFKYSNLSLAGSNGMLGCFAVRAGQLSYSGTLAPRVEDGRPVTHQVQDPPGFRILLQQQYPQVAKQFPAPPAAG